MQGDPQVLHAVLSRGRDFEELIVGREPATFHAPHEPRQVAKRWPNRVLDLRRLFGCDLRAVHGLTPLLKQDAARPMIVPWVSEMHRSLRRICEGIRLQSACPDDTWVCDIRVM
jgi:hypothetical protein